MPETTPSSPGSLETVHGQAERSASREARAQQIGRAQILDNEPTWGCNGSRIAPPKFSVNFM